MTAITLANVLNVRSNNNQNKGRSKTFWIISLFIRTVLEMVAHVTAWIWRRNYSSILLRSENTPKTNPPIPPPPEELARDRLTIRGHFGHMASASLVTSPPARAAYPETAKEPLVLITHNRWRCWFLSGFSPKKVRAPLSSSLFD